MEMESSRRYADKPAPLKRHRDVSAHAALTYALGGFHTPPVKAPVAMGSSATPKVVFSGMSVITKERGSEDRATMPLHAQNSPWQSSSNGVWSCSS